MTRSTHRPEGSLKRSLVNGAFFQMVWIACVAGGAAGLWWAGPLAVLAFAAWHLPRSAAPGAELMLAGTAAAAGLVIDTALLRAGLLAYPNPGPISALAPVWIVALWAGFAFTLDHSLAWLHGRPLLAAVLGAVSGPFSYWVGARTWKAVSFEAPTAVVLGVLALVWAVAVPALLLAAERYRPADGDGFEPARSLARVPLLSSVGSNNPTKWSRR